MKYKMAWPYFPDQEVDWLLGEFRQILDGTAMLSMGPRVKEFESLFSKYIGTDFAVGTNSCTAALEIALRSIDIQKNDEVIVPVETFVATASAVVRENGTPIFCDIDSESYCLSFSEMRKKVTERTKAVILVHMSGMISPDALLIKEFCDKQNIILIEDAAHAPGASIDGISAGAIGHMACFSFYPTKIITTAEGGMLVCSEQSIFDKADSYRNRGRDMASQVEVYSRLGTNNRMTEMTALLGISQMRCLDGFLKIRRSIANVYNDRLNKIDVNSLVKPINVSSNINHSYWRYIITLDPSIDREMIKYKLSSFGIQIDWAYYPPVHLQPYFVSEYGCKEGQYPVAEDLLSRNICLPINPTMTIDDAEFVVNKFVESIT